MGQAHAVPKVSKDNLTDLLWPLQLVTHFSASCCYGHEAHHVGPFHMPKDEAIKNSVVCPVSDLSFLLAELVC